jgi:hypothetical protein
VGDTDGTLFANIRVVITCSEAELRRDTKGRSWNVTKAAGVVMELAIAGIMGEVQ